jgi:hypothetical protein
MSWRPIVRLLDPILAYALAPASVTISGTDCGI